MSKRRRRNSRRRKSSCSSKQSISPYSFPNNVKSQLDSVLQKDDIAEKGETDSFCKEIILSDEEEKETESPIKDSATSKQAHDTDSYRNKKAKPMQVNKDKELKITHSVTIEDFGRCAPKIVIQRSHDSAHEEPVSIEIAVTTSKTRSSSMKLKINEVVLPGHSNVKTTLVYQNKMRQTANKETLTHRHSWGQDKRGCKQNGRPCKHQSFDINITELKANTADSSSSQEELDCCKSRCKDPFCRCYANRHVDTDFTLLDGSSTCSSPSSFWLPRRHPSLPENLSNETWDIPPPQDFADKDSAVFQDLTENIRSCQINNCNVFKEQGDSQLEPRTLENTLWYRKSRYQLQHYFKRPYKSAYYNLLYDNDPQKHDIDPEQLCRSPTLFSQSHEGKSHLHNRSTSSLESSIPSYVEIPIKRRRTFPGAVDQSLPAEAEGAARFYLDDERLRLFEGGSQKSSSSSNFPPSSSSICGHDTIVSDIKAYSTVKNPFYPSVSDETSVESFFKGEHDSIEPTEVSVLKNMADQEISSTYPLEQSEVTESGFDEEMIDLDECGAVVFSEDSQQNNLQIHVTPPSPYNSQEHISEGGSEKAQISAGQEASTPKTRKSSVVTIVLGGYEQRVLHNSPKEPVQKHQSPITNIETSHAVSKPTSVTSTEQHAVQKHDPSIEESHNLFDLPSKCSLSPSNKMRCQTGKRLQGRQTLHFYQSDSADRQTTPKPSTEINHLTPPEESMVKESEETSDHWAKKRKLFKENRQWGSTGGSSMTSNITDESDTVSSEDTRSVDLSLRDIEDRGFYTETFHSTSWIYRGDDINPNETPSCLSNRPRSVAVRERTVRISKGVGEYPWGFRIQFSKPIIVTEVDTNGAAEEAGLKVGDYVLAVNGTDVTGVPYSEAVDLARQGPALLILTVGSDIGRTPTTPRPACRGYLHKRTQSSLLKGWRKRWFVLRHDCCLYYYRNKRDEGKSCALFAMRLEGAMVESDTSLGKPFVFKCSPVGGNRIYYFCATSNQEMRRWLEALERAVHPITQNHIWLDVTRHNSNLPPLAVKNPECLGLLNLLGKNKDTWVQHYCILKDGCLYFYGSIRSTHAVGGIYLHGYTVREQPLGFKRSTIELKPPSEEFKVFYLCAENANENKRWTGAIKASIGKWLPFHQAFHDYMSRPLEETKM